MQERRIVILGAGFGGLAAALEFERLQTHLPGMEVVLLDQHNYHLFMPLLYQVGTGGIEPGNICFPLRSMINKGGTGPPVMFRECQVQGVDVERKTVFTNRMDLKYDYLVFALGSTTNFYGLPDIESHVMPLKTLKDGIALHNRILESFETALLEPDEQKRRELLTFAVVGGGATGVETACTTAIFVFKTLARDFPPLVPQARVALIEGADSLLRGMRPEMGRIALQKLKSRGVEVLLNCPVACTSPTGIQTRDGRSIPTRNIVWVAGVRPVALAETLPADKARDGRIVVDDQLEVAALPGLYVIGDCAYRTQFGASIAYPPTAQIAIQEGRAVARNIAWSIMGRPQQPFSYDYRGELIYLGRNHAVGEIGNRVIDGAPAFWLYQTYYLNKLMGFKKKLSTLIDWAYDYFYRRNTAKLD